MLLIMTADVAVQDMQMTLSTKVYLVRIMSTVNVNDMHLAITISGELISGELAKAWTSRYAMLLVPLDTIIMIV